MNNNYLESVSALWLVATVIFLFGPLLFMFLVHQVRLAKKEKEGKNGE